MGKQYENVVGNYLVKIEEGTPVIFPLENGCSKLQFGIIHKGKIYHMDSKGEKLEKKELKETSCMPIPDEYVLALWKLFVYLWLKVCKIPVDASLVYNNHFTPFKDDYSDWIETSNQNFERLRKVDEQQRLSNQVLYRYLDFPYADGKAYYQITGICGSKVKIESCKGLGDDYEYPEYGSEFILELEEAVQLLKGRDAVQQFFNKRIKGDTGA